MVMGSMNKALKMRLLVVGTVKEDVMMDEGGKKARGKQKGFVRESACLWERGWGWMRLNNGERHWQ